MSEPTLTPTPVAPGQEQAATPPPAPAAPPPSPSQEARAALQAKYENLYTPPEVITPPVETPAPAAATPPETPAPDPIAQALTAVLDRLAALETSMKPQTPAAVAPPTSDNATADWLALLSEGKKAEAEQALRDQLAVPDGAAIIAQAVEQMRVEQELTDFTRKVQADNADIAEMEPYISSMVGFEANAKFAGKRPSPTEYSTFYKEAVTRHVEAARKLVLGFRGQGATTATTRTTQVLAQPTLVPQPVNTNRETPPPEPQAESTEQYLARRQNRSAVDRGLVARA